MIKTFVAAIVFFVLTTGSTSYAKQSEVVKVDLFIKNHKFEPEILELPAGKKINITVHNEDSTIEEFESIDLKREKMVFAKSKTHIILAPLEPGEYKFFGDFHSETAQGKIIIKEETEKDA